jgi:hypothetical protein
MTDTDSSLLTYYLRHRRWLEVVLWLLLAMVINGANIVVVVIDQRRHDQSFGWVAPFIWEFTSAAVVLLLLPLLVRFDRRFPLQLATWRRSLLAHLLATIPFSIIHVTCMVWLRQLIYAALGDRYDFGNWLHGFFYEYLKDVRSYFFLLTVVYLYRFVLLRLQGEARLLTAPDTGPPVAAIEHPETFLVKKLGAEFLLAARDIEWLEASENYVNLHLRGRTYPLRSTMTAIQDRLDPDRFIRVHRSYIVNIDAVQQVEPLETGDARLTLKDGARVPCSRRYREALKSIRSVGPDRGEDAKRLA